MRKSINNSDIDQLLNFGYKIYFSISFEFCAQYLFLYSAPALIYDKVIYQQSFGYIPLIFRQGYTFGI